MLIAAAALLFSLGFSKNKNRKNNKKPDREVVGWLLWPRFAIIFEHFFDRPIEKRSSLFTVRVQPLQTIGAIAPTDGSTAVHAGAHQIKQMENINKNPKRLRKNVKTIMFSQPLCRINEWFPFSLHIHLSENSFVIFS